MFFCIAVHILFIVDIWILFTHRNKKRAEEWLGNEAKAHENGFLDLTHLEKEQFKYVYYLGLSVSRKEVSGASKGTTVR